jgi:hypothetical protein
MAALFLSGTRPPKNLPEDFSLPSKPFWKDFAASKNFPENSS